MNRFSLFMLCLTLASSSSSAPAESATKQGVLQLLEASLTAGEGAAAQALLEQYLTNYPMTARVLELQILTAFYAGDYESAAAGVVELRKDSNAPTDLGFMADLVIDTYETTKGYATATYDNFEVRYEPGPDVILVPYAIEALKAATEAMELELGVKMVSPVRLEIYPDADSLARVSTLSVEAIRNSGTIALSKWGRLMIASPRALMRGYPWLDTIAHEYVHLLITKSTLDRAPVWLQEGIAKLLETRWRLPQTQLPDDPASRRLLLGAAEDDALLDFDQLHPSIALLPSQRDAALAFAQVSSFMQMFYARHGREGVQRALAEITGGVDARKALAAVADSSWKKLEADWKKSLASQPKPPAARFVRRHLKGEATETDELAEVEREKARKYVQLGDLLWVRSRPAAASVEYGKAHRVAPSDPIVASRYARSAIAGGRPKDAIKPLVYTLLLYPNHAPAQSNLAMARLRAGNENGAAYSALRAIALNPFDPQPHCVLAELGGPSAATERDLCTRLGGVRQ